VSGLGLDVAEVPIRIEDLGSYQSAFATNAAMGAGPIEKIDGYRFDIAHPLIAQVKERYEKLPKSELVLS